MAEKLCTLRTKGGGGGAKQEETVLWTNPNPADSSGFAAQTVTLSDSIDNYDYIKILYRYNKSTYIDSNVIYSVSDFKKSIIDNGTEKCIALLGLQTSANPSYTRIVGYVTSTSVKFTTSFQISGTANSANANIPLSIIGIKNMGGTAHLKDYAFMAIAGNASVNVGDKYTTDSNVISVSYDQSTQPTSGTMTVLEEGMYEYMATALNRGNGTATVQIGSTVVAKQDGTRVAHGEIYIQANTTCTLTSNKGTSTALSEASLTLVKKS